MTRWAASAAGRRPRRYITGDEMNKTTAVRGLAVSAAAAALVLHTAGPASAAQVGGSCIVGDFSAAVYLNYHNSGSYHDVDSYSWIINGQKNSTKNNVHGKLRRVIPGGYEQLHSFARDDVHNGGGERSVDGLYPNSYALYVTMEFIFDRNNGSDPRCTAVTPTV